MRRSGISEIAGQTSGLAGEASERVAATIELSDEDSRILDRWLHASDTPKTVACRARIVREAARGRSNSEIARELGVSRGTVILWRRRFAREGLLAISEVRPGRGRRRSVSARVVRALVRAARRPVTSERVGDVRMLAAASGVSAATVYRVWDAHGVRRAEHSRVTILPEPADPLLGVYVDPPDRAIVLRRGAFAPAPQVNGSLARAVERALARLDRRVVGPGLPRDRERAFLKFLRQIERATAPASFVLVVDAGGGTHRRETVRGWLDARPRIEMRIADGAGATAALLTGGFDAGSPSFARNGSSLRSLLEELRGYLAFYEGEPDRFVWIAASAAR